MWEQRNQNETKVSRYMFLQEIILWLLHPYLHLHHCLHLHLPLYPSAPSVLLPLFVESRLQVPLLVYCAVPLFQEPCHWQAASCDTALSWRFNHIAAALVELWDFCQLAFDCVYDFQFLESCQSPSCPAGGSGGPLRVSLLYFLPCSNTCQWSTEAAIIEAAYAILMLISNQLTLYRHSPPYKGMPV